VKSATGLSLVTRKPGPPGGEEVTAVPKGSPFARLAVDKDVVAVFDGEAIHLRKAGKWTTVKIAPKLQPPMMGVPGQVVLSGSTLYGAWAKGEWGGALVAFDVATGKWKELGATGDPVTDLETDASGSLWVTRGQMHMGMYLGALERIAAGGGRTEIARVTVDGVRVAWDLEPTSFEAVAIDGDKVYVLSSVHGLVRREQASGAWTRVTPWWPGFTYVSDAHVRGDIAVIATYDAGVWIADLAQGTVKRVPYAKR
jgi:hypothetical protein